MRNVLRNNDEQKNPQVKSFFRSQDIIVQSYAFLALRTVGGGGGGGGQEKNCETDDEKICYRYKDTHPPNFFQNMQFFSMSCDHPPNSFKNIRSSVLSDQTPNLTVCSDSQGPCPTKNLRENGCKFRACQSLH